MAAVVGEGTVTERGQLGLGRGDLGLLEDEIEAYKQVIRIRPEFALAYHNLGVAYSGLGLYKNAIEAYRELIRIKPDDAKAQRL